MGVSGSDHGEFQRALRAGNWASAFAAAYSLPVVRLEGALELVFLGAEQVGKDRYETACLQVADASPGRAPGVAT